MCQRIDAAMGEEQPGAGELAAIHPQGTLVEIGAQHVGHGAVEIAHAVLSAASDRAGTARQ